MRFLVYDESTKKHWLRPRHPFVAYNDLTVSIVAAALCTYSLIHHSWFAVMYFGVVAIQFLVSSNYHWQPYNRKFELVDRAAIYLLIAATPLPYYTQIVSAGNEFWLTSLWITALCGTTVVLLGKVGSRSVLTALMYLSVGGLAVVSMLGVEQHFDEQWMYVFWGAIVLYVYQLITYTFGWFDFVPNAFGSHDSMHLKLTVAIALNAYAVVAYVLE